MRKGAAASKLWRSMSANNLLEGPLMLVAFGPLVVGSGGRGVVIVLESARMVIPFGCWSSRTWIDGNLMLICDCQLKKINYAYV